MRYASNERHSKALSQFGSSRFVSFYKAVVMVSDGSTEYTVWRLLSC